MEQLKGEGNKGVSGTAVDLCRSKKHYDLGIRILRAENPMVTKPSPIHQLLKALLGNRCFVTMKRANCQPFAADKVCFSVNACAYTRAVEGE